MTEQEFQTGEGWPPLDKLFTYSSNTMTLPEENFDRDCGIEFVRLKNGLKKLIKEWETAGAIFKKDGRVDLSECVEFFIYDLRRLRDG